MDRTADFRRLAGLASAGATLDASAPPVPTCAFMRAAGDLRGRLARLRRGLQYDEEGPAAEIQGCRGSMAELEGLLGEVADLGPRAPPPQQRHDLMALRRGMLRDLYEELRDLASRVQTLQMQEMRHDTEVASFFTAAAGSRAPPLRRKPPPAALGAEEVAGSGGGLATGGASAEQLRAEEQQLLAAFETNLDQIHQVRQRLGEVASMVSVFATKAEEQQEVAAQILGDAEVSTQHVEDAGKHLQKANDNKSSYNFYIVCWFMGSGIFLLIFDYIDARFSWI